MGAKIALPGIAADLAAWFWKCKLEEITKHTTYILKPRDTNHTHRSVLLLVIVAWSWVYRSSATQCHGFNVAPSNSMAIQPRDASRPLKCSYQCGWCLISFLQFMMLFVESNFSTLFWLKIYLKSAKGNGQRNLNLVVPVLVLNVVFYPPFHAIMRALANSPYLALWLPVALLRV